MKCLTTFSRIVVGLLFILSGWVKLIDPIGFSYKLEEYFSPSVFDLPFLMYSSLLLSVLLSFFEVLIGLMLWLGVAKKFTLISLSALILFFGFLTFYSAYFHKVTECGCFGGVLSLTPWQSFGKNVLLLLFVLPLIGDQAYIQPIFSKKVRLMLLLIISTGFSAIVYRGLAHLPVMDFSPYAVGKSITKQIKTAEELGLDPPQYQILYTLKNIQDQSEKTVTDREYIDRELWKNPLWQIQPEKTIQKKIKNGYEPPIHDFALKKGEQDVTKEILSTPFVLLVICHNLLKADSDGMNKLKIYVPQWKKLKVQLIGLSSSEVYEQYGFSWAFGDATLLKTIVRSNPGLALLKEGTIVKKWHWRDMPMATELQSLIHQK